MPFLPPNQQRQSTEGCHATTRILEKLSVESDRHICSLEKEFVNLS